jgi:hypothetical protein
MTSFWSPTRFSFLNEKLYFCPHIAEICPKVPKIAEIFHIFFIVPDFVTNFQQKMLVYGSSISNNVTRNKV